MSEAQNHNCGIETSLMSSEDANRCRHSRTRSSLRRYRTPRLLSLILSLATIYSFTLFTTKHQLEGTTSKNPENAISNFFFVEAFGGSQISLSKSRCFVSRMRGSQTSTSLSVEGQSEREGTASSSSNEITFQGITYRTRDCDYRDLSTVAGIMVESFYDKKINLVARKLYQLAETSRLQNNFPYPESRSIHRMLVMEAKPEVATTEAGAPKEPLVVGFCDVDCRPCATKLKLPRPYLSDVAIDPNHRRRGLAKLLVEEAEDFVRNCGSSTKEDPFGELWIRVASDNAAALGLYREKMGYSLAEWSTGEDTKALDNDQPEIFTLRKDLSNT